MITVGEINKSLLEYKSLEGRAYYFELAKNLLQKGYIIEADILVLSTWNFARFRYHMKDFDIDNYKNVLSSLRYNFDIIKNENIITTDLNKYRDQMKIIFDSLSNIDGIEFTGAPKLMHLRNPNLFIMWDSYIRGAKNIKYYENINLFKNGDYIYKKYSSEFNGYYEFLGDMKKYFKDIDFKNENKSFAKAIDEFNYVKITFPIQKIEKEEKKERKNTKLLKTINPTTMPNKS